METGKVTITFYDDETHSLDVNGVNGVELMSATVSIINEINKNFEISLALIIGKILENV
ncbi:hypothetical protein ACQ7EN_08095 [Leuconostoc lactis]|uniref:hypothetical protein n=1 Tax=Leuconostoc lactis TaxID=1246 RepID=UPI003D6A9A04